MEKFCEIIETEESQILIKKEWDCEKEIYSVIIEADLIEDGVNQGRISFEPKMSKGSTSEDQDRFFDKMVSRVKDYGYNFILSFMGV